MEGRGGMNAGAHSSMVWVGDRLVVSPQAQVSVFDRAFTVGDGVFETLKVSEGQAFALTRHLERLAASARGLGLPEPDLDAVRRAVAQTIDANIDAQALGRLRIEYTAGTGGPGSERAGGEPLLTITCTPATPWPASTPVVTVPWPRNERSAIVGLKTTSYADNVVALAHAHAAGAGEALMPNTVGMLCEGTGSNVFLILGGEVVTPPVSSGCLPGITRALVIEWCGATEREVPLSALADAQEVFLTSSTRDVQPVSAVDGGAVPNTPGPLTRSVQRVFAECAARDSDP
jgi:branched-chain amino acid aminotransferase